MSPTDLGTPEQFRECMELLLEDVRPNRWSRAYGPEVNDDPALVGQWVTDTGQTVTDEPTFDDMLAIIGAAAVCGVHVFGWDCEDRKGWGWEYGAICQETDHPTPLAAVAAGLRARQEADDGR